MLLLRDEWRSIHLHFVVIMQHCDILSSTWSPSAFVVYNWWQQLKRHQMNNTGEQWRWPIHNANNPAHNNVCRWWDTQRLAATTENLAMDFDRWQWWCGNDTNSDTRDNNCFLHPIQYQTHTRHTLDTRSLTFHSIKHTTQWLPDDCTISAYGLRVIICGRP